MRRFSCLASLNSPSMHLVRDPAQMVSQTVSVKRDLFEDIIASRHGDAVSSVEPLVVVDLLERFFERAGAIDLSRRLPQNFFFASSSMPLRRNSISNMMPSSDNGASGLSFRSSSAACFFASISFRCFVATSSRWRNLRSLSPTPYAACNASIPKSGVGEILYEQLEHEIFGLEAFHEPGHDRIVGFDAFCAEDGAGPKSFSNFTESVARDAACTSLVMSLSSLCWALLKMRHYEWRYPIRC